MNIWLPAIRAGTGTDVFTERLVAGLGARGVDARITWYPPATEFFPALMRLRQPPPGTDIIHGNGWTVAPFLRGRLPVVTTVHHLVHDPAFAPYRSRAQALYHRWHLRASDARAVRDSAAVTSVSSYVAGTVRRIFGRERVHVIPNWVDTNLYRPAADRAPSGSDQPLRLLWVGNPSRRKGADLLPALAHRMAGRAVIRCVGGLRGDEPATLAAGNLTWIGRLSEPELIAEYQQCDVLLSLSRYEGFGYSALEAMACGRPVVAFAAGGLVDVVRHGVTGLLSSVDDLDALAADLLTLADDRVRLQTMGAAGRALACDGADPVQAYIDLYAEVLASRSHTRG